MRSCTAPRFLIQGTLPADSMGVLYGSWGVGKTFVALDLALRVALGVDLQGRLATGGGVVYLCAEGTQGLARRVAAWRVVHGRDLDFERAPICYAGGGWAMGDRGDLAGLRREISRWAETHGAAPSLIVGDTLSRHMGSADENSSKDMAGVVASTDEHLRRAFGATLLWVHHIGHGARTRARGSSVLPAAADFEYRLRRVNDRMVLECTKSRDFAPPMPVSYRLVKVPFVGDESEPYESAAAAPREIAEGEAIPDSRLGKKQRAALEWLRAEYVRRRTDLEESGYDPISVRIEEADWRAWCKEHHMCGESRQSWHRMRTALVRAEKIRCQDGYVSPAEAIEL